MIVYYCRPGPDLLGKILTMFLSLYKATWIRMNVGSDLYAVLLVENGSAWVWAVSDICKDQYHIELDVPTFIATARMLVK